MKAYFLTNQYLSSIQHGIQSLHCLQEINNKYLDEHKVLTEWATNYKTVVILNGGCYAQMQAVVKLLEHDENELPWATFQEPSLGNVLTSIGIIVPEYIYGRERYDIGSFEYELYNLLRQSPTAK